MSNYYDLIFMPGIDYQDKKPVQKQVSSEGDVPLFAFSNDFTDTFSFSLKKPKKSIPEKTPVEIPKVGNVSEPFEAHTKSLMYKTPHKTKFLNIAQDHLGIQEVTKQEYEKLSSQERQNTQMHLMENYGRVDHQWCAHTVSHIAEESGINIDGHKNHVQGFIDWGKTKGIYNPIRENTAVKSNYKQEREFREKQIKAQFKKMNEGDLIIWKSSYVAELPNNELIEKKSSHIGIIESVNPDGTITVIEGNANEFMTESSERYLVKTPQEAKIGNQDISDFKEVNQRDGVIRKTYTAENLASFGYSGYIDMQKLVK